VPRLVAPLAVPRLPARAAPAGVGAEGEGGGGGGGGGGERRGRRSVRKREGSGLPVSWNK